MSEMIPVVDPGRARAFSRFTAGSGNLITPGIKGGQRFQSKFRMGRHRGKTYDQVVEEFNTLWENADPRIREKYAKMAAVAPPYSSEAKPAEKPVAVAKPAAKPAAPVKTPTFEELTNPNVRSPDGMIHSIGSGEPSRPQPGVFMNFGGMPGPISPMQTTGQIESDPTRGTATAAAGAVGRKLSEVAQDVADPGLAGVRAEKRAADEASAQKAAAANEAKKAADLKARQDAERVRLGLPVKAPAASVATEMQGPPASAAGGVAEKPAVAAPVPQGPVTQANPLPGRTDNVAVAKPRWDEMQSPAGMELVGMKGGVPQYKPIGEVYGGATGKTTTGPAKGNIMLGGGGAASTGGGGESQTTTISDSDIRAQYQTKMQADMGLAPKAAPVPVKQPSLVDQRAAESLQSAQALKAASYAKPENPITMNEINARYREGTPEANAAAMGVNPSTGKQLTREDLKAPVKRPVARM